MNCEDMKKLSKHIPLIGRKDELKRLREYLQATGTRRRYVYYWAHGGLGKTRLLEEFEQMVKKAGPRFHFSGILDLYHTDTHSTSDLERIIVQGLDPQGQYFSAYRQERRTYELLRERGTDPNILEERRTKLGDLFVEGCNEMALQADKLVICFDTIELLQYESSVVEEKAGLDTADTRVKPWLIEKLAKLQNVLVVFAGRPKLRVPDESTDPQARLVADMQKAFGEDLDVVELQSFTFEETCEFLKFFEDQAQQVFIPADYLTIVYRLTEGRPILLHLIVDWITVLARETRTILQLFDRYKDLTEAKEGAPRLAEARREIEQGILNTLFNDSGEIGGYLSEIALMPKGVDVEILKMALGMPDEEAARWLEALADLSFVKRYKTPPGVRAVRGEQLFLHDEVYRLLTSQKIIPHLRKNERRIANTLIQVYYDPHIKKLGEDLEKSNPEERLALRERWQKLHVERIYYLLVADPHSGYEEYKRVTDLANRHRWVGFAMRLLDEFLRFYSDTALERRRLFEAVGITNAQIVRESVWMWVERFDWWGQDQQVIGLAEHILTKPEDFLIQCSADITVCPDQDLVTMGNVYAYWTGACARLKGYEPSTVETALKMLKHWPPPEKWMSEYALAYARLATAIGFQYRLGGLLNQAIEYYVRAKAAFLRMKNFKDYEEYTLLLQSLATAYAIQGNIASAWPLAFEALRINEEIGSEYSMGLTLIALSRIEHLCGNYHQELEYGNEALTIFQELKDSRGIATAQLTIARAKRWIAKQEMEKQRKSQYERIRQLLKESQDTLEKALLPEQDTSDETHKANIDSVIPDLYAELGRVYRDLAYYNKLQNSEEGFRYYRQAEQQLRLALDKAKWGIVDRASTLHDLAEVLFALEDTKIAQDTLKEIRGLVGSAHQITLNEGKVLDNLPPEYFTPLGKVELLEGSNAFKEGRPVEGIKHYILAFAYFAHFSSEAVETKKMSEYLYNYMQDMPLDRRRETLAKVQKWVNETTFGVDVGKFVKNVADLLSV